MRATALSHGEVHSPWLAKIKINKERKKVKSAREEF